MKKIIWLFFIAVFLMSNFLSVDSWFARATRTKSSDVYVKWHYRSWKWIPSHYRSKADWVISNNYSCIDNWNCWWSTSTYTSTKSVTTNKVSNDYNYWTVNSVIGTTKTSETLNYLLPEVVNVCKLDKNSKLVIYDLCLCINGYHIEWSKCIQDYSDSICREIYWDHAIKQTVSSCMCENWYIAQWDKCVDNGCWRFWNSVADWWVCKCMDWYSRNWWIVWSVCVSNLELVTECKKSWWKNAEIQNWECVCKKWFYYNTESKKCLLILPQKT